MKRRLFNAVTLLSVLLVLLAAGLWWRSTQVATDMINLSAGTRSLHLWAVDGWVVLGLSRSAPAERWLIFDREPPRPDGINEVVGRPQFPDLLAYDTPARAIILCLHLRLVVLLFGALPAIWMIRWSKRVQKQARDEVWEK